MLDKLIAAVIRKNGSCSSSDINSCSVRVNANPLLADCVVGHRLVSDLELGLQDNRVDIIAMLNDSARTPKYAEAGARHVSASWLFNHLSSLDSAISDKLDQIKASPVDKQPSAEPAPSPAPSPSPAN